MPYDVASVRAHFPALAEGAAHFDGPGGSQTPDVVAKAVAETLTSAISNRGGVTPSERRAEQVVTDCRAALADLLGADPRGIVFGRSATSLTYDVARALAKDWGPGDEVVVTRLDHDANIRPWVHAAEAAGATVRWVDFDPTTGELSADAVAAVLSDRTRLVATTAASNLIGTRTPVCRVADLAHEVGALHWVDGVHATAHASSTWSRCARTSGPARPTSSWGRTVACSPPTRRCSRPSTPTSCSRRPMPCPSGSSSAPCPTS